MRKVALDTNIDQPFEQVFANLAHQFIADKLSPLLPYEVGFQLLSKSEDNTKACGIFGFKIGDNWAYVPIFFLNGSIKGPELLYLKNQDQFVPTSEDWLNEVLERRPIVLGKGVSNNLSVLGVLAPNLFQIARNPYKYAAALPPLASWAQDFLPILAHLVLEDPQKKCAQMKNWPGLLKEAGVAVCRTFLQELRHWPTIYEGIEDFYGESFLPQLVRTIKQAERPPVASPERPPRTEDNSGAQVLTLDELLRPENAAILHDLDLKEKEKLLQEKVIVRDHRGPHEVTLVYDVQTPLSLYNPSESGCYEILVQPSTFARCLCVSPLYTAKGRKMLTTVVRLDGEKDWLTTHSGHIWALARYDRESFEDWWKGLPPVEELGKRRPGTDNCYLLIMRGGQGTAPFQLLETYTPSQEGSQCLDVQFHDRGEWTTPLPISYYPRDWTSTHPSQSAPNRILLTGRQGNVFRITAHGLEVPASARFLTLAGNPRKFLQLGNLIDLQMAVGSLPPLVVQSDGSRYTINDRGGQDKTAALRTLVQFFGLSVRAAQEVLKKADHGCRVQVGLYKQAAPPMNNMITGAPNAPSFPEPNYMFDPQAGGNVPAILPSVWYERVPDLSAARTDINRYAPLRGDPRTLAAIGQAVQAGQKEVFDTGMLGALLHLVREPFLIDRYLPDIMLGLDRLCRILFILYWHGQAFAERYGIAELTLLEDVLRNAIDAVGIVALELRKRAIYPGLGDRLRVSLKDLARQ
jgi:hypothetical protein